MVTGKIKEWYFVSLFSSNSCGKQLEKPNEQWFCILKLQNGGRKQANGSRDSFWPEGEARGSEWFEAAICLLETSILQREKTKLLEFGIFQVFFAT